MIYRMLLALLLPLGTLAQEIKSNETDAVTNERTIETSIVTLKSGFSTGFGVSFTAVNTTCYLNIIGYGQGDRMLDETDSIWFVLSNGAIAKLNAPLQVSGEAGAYQNMYLYHYYIPLEMVEAMKDHPVVLARIVAGKDDVTDIAITKKNSKAFAKLCSLFLTEVSK